MHLEKTTDTGEWQKGKYYVAGETFTYKTMLFYVTEDHFADDDNKPLSNMTDKGKLYPFRRVYEADSITSLTRKKKGQ